jgi:hypothetical protein
MSLEARQAFETFIAGRAAGRATWMPCTDTLAARLAGTAYRTLAGDAGLWSGGLLKAAELLGADAMIAGFDWTLAAEICGAPIDWSGALPMLAGPASVMPDGVPATSRQAVAIETVRRLGAIARRDFGITAAVTGPMTLAAQAAGTALAEDDAPKRTKSLHATLTEAMLRARPDLILFCERLDATTDCGSRPWQRAYATLRNLAGYYNVQAGIYVEGFREAQLAGLSGLRLEFCLLGAGNVDSPVDAARALCRTFSGVGIPVPTESAHPSRALFAGVAEARKGGCNLCLTTAGAIGDDTDLAALRALAPSLRDKAAVSA